MPPTAEAVYLVARPYFAQRCADPRTVRAGVQSRSQSPQVLPDFAFLSLPRWPIHNRKAACGLMAKPYTYEVRTVSGQGRAERDPCTHPCFAINTLVLVSEMLESTNAAATDVDRLVRRLTRRRDPGARILLEACNAISIPALQLRVGADAIRIQQSLAWLLDEGLIVAFRSGPSDLWVRCTMRGTLLLQLASAKTEGARWS